MVVVQHLAQPLAARDRSTITSRGFIRDDQPVAETLVVSLALTMRHEFANRLPDGSDKSLRMGIQIRRPRRQSYRLHSTGGQRSQKLSGEQRVAVVNQVSRQARPCPHLEGEEVRCDDHLPVPAQELFPGRLSVTLRRGFQTELLENVGDRTPCDLVAQIGQCTLDAPIAPIPVLRGPTNDQVLNSIASSGTTGPTLLAAVILLGDQLPVPGQACFRVVPGELCSLRGGNRSRHAAAGPTNRRWKPTTVETGRRSGALAQDSSEDRRNGLLKPHHLRQIEFLDTTGSGSGGAGRPVPHPRTEGGGLYTRQIADELNRQGVTTRRGTAWRVQFRIPAAGLGAGILPIRAGGSYGRQRTSFRIL